MDTLWEKGENDCLQYINKGSTIIVYEERYQITNEFTPTQELWQVCYLYVVHVYVEIWEWLLFKKIFTLQFEDDKIVLALIKHLGSETSELDLWLKYRYSDNYMYSGMKLKKELVKEVKLLKDRISCSKEISKHKYRNRIYNVDTNCTEAAKKD